LHLASEGNTRTTMATIGGTMATAGDVRKEQAEARVVERRRRLEEERKMRSVRGRHGDPFASLALGARAPSCLALPI
jgi:hypothetical protein